MRSIVFTITNDISYDQRMHRICKTLAHAGYAVTLIGRRKKNSIPLKKEIYGQKRLPCWFTKGKLFYVEYNIRLLLYLMTLKTDIIGAIDLDTLLPCFITSKIRNKTIVFDAHEHFTELIEVVNRPFTRSVWLGIEKMILPRIKYAYTVSENLRRIFTEKYGLAFSLIRNISEYETYAPVEKKEKYFIYAGAVNLGRGLDEMIQAMPHIPCKLYICGMGELTDHLQLKSKALQLEDKVVFLGYVPPETLKNYIRGAFAGCLLLENMGLSYYYSLANKFFDYMHAGIPQITIDFPEYQVINNDIQVADLIPLQVDRIIEAANQLLTDQAHYDRLSSNALLASKKYSWQGESEKLLEFYKNIS